ncbi:MAG: efflux RND transporter periplasmic adaptor subunit [Alphaproteobacteria bacterium]|nr:efflux RND transporter periplasmic adaptor subunit [Alphaproteobacteria bacterium]
MKSPALACVLPLAVFALCGRAVADPAALVTLAIVKSGSLQQQVTTFGTIAADPGGVTTVAIPRDGIVAAVSVRPGQMVKRGDAIATVDTAPAAAAQFSQARSSLDFARKDLEHTKALFGEQLATKSQLAAAEKAYSDALALYRQQQNIGADQAQQVLRAPAPGAVTAVSVSPGDRVAANTVLATISNRDHLVVNLGLEPEVAAAVPVGAPVRLTSAQDSAIGFWSKVLSVAAMLDPQSRLVNAVAEVPANMSPHLFLGMSLEARIDLPARRGLTIPKSALMADEKGTYVFVVSSGKAHRRDVTVVFETPRDALVAGGLKANEQVVSAGNSGVEDGVAVRTK